PISYVGGQPVDLTNCDREPIHIPGSIQPHGALLAFTPDATLAVYSENAAALLGDLPEVGNQLDATHLTPAIRATISAALTTDTMPEDLLGAQLSNSRFDIIFSQSEGLLVVEFEQVQQARSSLDSFATASQRAIARIQQQTCIDDLLRVTVEELRKLTGFDRVMAYRFLPDNSGEVVAEWRREDLEPFIGQRYPASDIPAQARRLYILNPLRLIANLGYRPVPLQPQ